MTRPNEYCPDCGTPREHRVCAECGFETDVIDCGHHIQPAVIAASAYAAIPDLVCGDCEWHRWHDMVMTGGGR